MSQQDLVLHDNNEASPTLDSLLDIQSLERLLAAIPQQVWISDLKGRVIYASPRSSAHFNIPVEKILAYNWLELICPEDLGRLQTRLAEAFSYERDCDFDLRFKDKEGNYRWHVLRASPIRNADGKIHLWALTNTDISTQKNIELALTQSHQQNNLLHTRGKIGLWRHDLRNSTTEWSEELYDILGFKRSSPPPTLDVFLKIVVPADRDKVKHFYTVQWLEADEQAIEFRVRNTQGATLWIEAKCEALQTGNPNPTELLGTMEDITDQKQTELKLQESELRFRVFLENTPCIAFIKNHEGRYVYVNSTYLNRFKIHEADILGKTVFEMLPAETAQRLHEKDVEIFQSKKPIECIEAIPGPDGLHYWHAIKFSFENSSGDIFLGCTAFDVSDHHHNQEELKHQKHLLELSQDVGKLGGWEFDLEKYEVLCNDQIFHILETNREEFKPSIEAGLALFDENNSNRVRESLDAAITYGTPFDLQLDMRTLKNNIIHVRLKATTTIESDKVVKVAGILQDISDQKKIQLELESANSDLAYANEVLEHIAHFDPLTHLPNRVLLSDRLKQAMIHNQRNQTLLAIAFIDLDGFKEVNDEYGHNLGDRVLMNVAHKMREALREGDTLARIGGDEFVAILSDLKEANNFEPMVNRLLKAAAEPIVVDGLQITVTASIGVTLYPIDNVDIESLLLHADQAMYSAKQKGKNCFFVYNTDQSSANKTRHQSLEQIRDALDKQQFEIFYQPKINLRTGSVVGMEALVRWRHPERGLLLPQEFLPFIDNHIYGIEIGEWVIHTALTQIHNWQKQRLRFPISVNLSTAQIEQENFAQRLKNILRQFPDVEPSLLELEIKESSVVEDFGQVLNTIEACNSLGVDVVLDNFGTGYASITHLKQLPIDLLKIDRVFIHNMLENADDLATIQGIIRLAKTFNRQVVAEGIETSAQGRKLLYLGCDFGQGFGIAKPMSADEMSHWLINHPADKTWLN